MNLLRELRFGRCLANSGRCGAMFGEVRASHDRTWSILANGWPRFAQFTPNAGQPWTTPTVHILYRSPSPTHRTHTCTHTGVLWGGGATAGGAQSFHANPPQRSSRRPAAASAPRARRCRRGRRRDSPEPGVDVEPVEAGLELPHKVHVAGELGEAPPPGAARAERADRKPEPKASQIMGISSGRRRWGPSMAAAKVDQSESLEHARRSLGLGWSSAPGFDRAVSAARPGPIRQIGSGPAKPVSQTKSELTKRRFVEMRAWIA